MITANQPFSGSDAVFPDKAMTVAAIDRLVHHATILEMNVESYRRRTAYAAAKSFGEIDEGSQRDTEKPDNEETATPLNDIETRSPRHRAAPS